MNNLTSKLRHALIILLVLVLSFGNAQGIVLAENNSVNEEIKEENENIEKTTVNFRVEGISKTLLENTEIEIKKDDPNALDVTKKALDQAGIPFELSGNIIFKIGDDEQSAFETWDGWNYMVNDVHPDVMSDDYSVKDGDEVVWFYGNEVDIYEGYDEVNELDKLTLRSNLSVEPNLVEEEEFEVKVTGTYDKYNMSFELKESGLKTPIEDVDVSFNNKIYSTDKNGVAKIPGEDAKIGEYEIRITKDIENSYPRILRKSKKVIIDGKEDSEEDSDDQIEPEVDKSELVKTITDAKNTSVEGKTKETVKVLKESIAEGETVQKNEKAASPEVNNAIKVIQTAIKNLEEIPEKNPDSLTEKQLKEKLNKSVDRAIGYAEKNFPDYTEGNAGSHSDYWAFSAFWAAGLKDIENDFNWKGGIKPSADHTFWEQKLSKANSTSNEDAGTIIGSVILDQSPYDFGTQNVVADLEAKQKEDGSFFHIYGEPWAMIALELVDSEVYKKDKHIDYILDLQNDEGMFGDADSTGWMLMALAPYTETHPAVKKAMENTINYIHTTYKETGTLPGMKFGENSNAITSMHMGLAANGENLLSDKWTNNKNIIAEFIEEYQFENGSFAWEAGSEIGAINMSTEQVILSLATVKEQESIFTQLKQAKNRANKDILEELVKEAKEIGTTNKTDHSVKALEKAIKESKTILDNESATQKEVDEVEKALNDAIENLKEKPNKSTIKVKSITDVEDLSVAYGTKEQAIKFPKKVELNLDNDTSVDVKVKWSLAEKNEFKPLEPGLYKYTGQYDLPENVSGDKPKVSMTVQILEEVVDKTELEDLIDSAKNITTNSKKDKSKNELLNTIKQVEKIMNDKKVNQSEIDQAVQTLEENISEFVEEEKELGNDKIENSKLKKNEIKEKNEDEIDQAVQALEKNISEFVEEEKDLDNDKIENDNLKKNETKEKTEDEMDNVQLNKDKQLPSTATNIFNILVLGLVLIVLGLLFIRKRNVN